MSRAEVESERLFGELFMLLSQKLVDSAGPGPVRKGSHEALSPMQKGRPVSRTALAVFTLPSSKAAFLPKMQEYAYCRNNQAHIKQSTYLEDYQ